MKRDWNKLLGTKNRYGVLFDRWTEEKENHRASDSIICICPLCDKEFVVSMITRFAYDDDNMQVKECSSCVKIKNGKLTSERLKGKPALNRKDCFNIGDRYNKLTILEIFYKDGNQWVKVQCDCGEIFEVISYNIIRKNNPVKQCKKCSRKEVANKIKEDLEPGSIYGFAKVINSGEPQKDSDGWNRSTSVCECLLCGNIFTAKNKLLKNGRIKSCGCMHSVLESLTMKELNKYEAVIYIHDKPWDKTLRSKSGRGLLKFDFTLLNTNKKAPTTLDIVACIECQGEQHYKDTGYFGRLQREETDEIKKEYCKAHDIPLYEIRYDEKDIVEQRVREILTELNLI